MRYSGWQGFRWLVMFARRYYLMRACGGGSTCAWGENAPGGGIRVGYNTATGPLITA